MYILLRHGSDQVVDLHENTTHMQIRLNHAELCRASAVRLLSPMPRSRGITDAGDSRSCDGSMMVMLMLTLMVVLIIVVMVVVVVVVVVVVLLLVVVRRSW